MGKNDVCEEKRGGTYQPWWNSPLSAAVAIAVLMVGQQSFYLSRLDLQGEMLGTEIASSEERLRKEFNGKFDTLNSKIDDKFNTLDDKFDDKFNTLDGKFDDKFNTLDDKFDTLQLLILHLHGNKNGDEKATADDAAAAETSLRSDGASLNSSHRGDADCADRATNACCHPVANPTPAMATRTDPHELETLFPSAAIVKASSPPGIWLRQTAATGSIRADSVGPMCRPTGTDQHEMSRYVQS